MSCADDAVAVDAVGPTLSDDGAAARSLRMPGVGIPDVISPAPITTLARDWQPFGWSEKRVPSTRWAPILEFAT